MNVWRSANENLPVVEFARTPLYSRPSGDSGESHYDPGENSTDDCPRSGRFNAWCSMVLLLASTVLLAHAAYAEDPYVNVSVERPGPLTRCVIEAPGVLKGGMDLHLVMNLQDGKARAVWSNRPVVSQKIDLTFDGSKLSGACLLLYNVPIKRGYGSAKPTDCLAEITMDLALADGRFKGTLGGESGIRGELLTGTTETLVNPDALTWEREDEWKPFSMEVDVPALTEETCKAQAPVAEDADWPAWNGPNCDFAAVSKGHALVDDLSQAMIQWKTERLPPGRSQITRYGGCLDKLTDRGPAGGGSSPIVYQGRVYQYFVQPAEGPYDEAHVKRMAEKGQQTAAILWAKRADDVVICFDASTGHTLWRTTIPKTGNYLQSVGSTKRGAYVSEVCAGAGKVFARSVGGRTVCLDAKTGTLQWAVERGQPEVPRVIGDVLVISGEKNALLGLDLETGEERWSAPGAGGIITAPMHWRHEGTDYIVTENAKLHCIEAASGRVVWVEDGYQSEKSSPPPASLVGDFVVLSRNREKQPKQLMAYRLTLKGAEQVWSLDPAGFAIDSQFYPTSDGRHVFVPAQARGEGTASTKTHMIDVTNGNVVASTERGNVRAAIAERMEDRIISQLDASHSATPLDYYRFTNNSIELLGETWPTRHRTSSSYSPRFWTHALVDGRMIIRGQRHLVCYDLRKP